MPCWSSRRSLAALHFSGSPTSTGTMWVSLGITGSPEATSTALVRAARPWWRSRSQLDVFRWAMAAAAAAQMAGGSAARRRQRGGEQGRGRTGAHGADQRGWRRGIAAVAAERLGQRALDHADAVHGALALADAGAARAMHAVRTPLVAIRHGVVAFGEV